MNKTQLTKPENIAKNILANSLFLTLTNKENYQKYTSEQRP
jgi:hypothetical protein